VGSFGPVSAIPSTVTRRVAVGVVLALVLAMVAVAVLDATGAVRFAQDPVGGRPVAVVEDVPGPETGPVCPVDARYVNESPEGLRADVLAAWRRLRAEADKNGVQLCVQDGKRSVGQQEKEFDEAVRRFGTRELAARYVLPPEKSMHVKGIAVDVQPANSAVWVEEHGGALGWCRRYANEQWHFEFHREYVTDGCPALLPSATGG
jgi:zinc D-Ala-D-Ala carboxypeptidase